MLEKVISLEEKRPHQERHQARRWAEHLNQVRLLSTSLARLQEEDVQAYLNLARARASRAQGQELAAAVLKALEVPREIMARVQEAQHLVAWAGGRCQAHLIADLLVALEFLGAALQGAYHIACANLPLLAPAPGRAALGAELFQAAHLSRKTFLKVKEELLGRKTAT